MGKRFVRYEAECPFYKEEERSVIYCEGITDNSRIHIAFDSDAERYKRKFCCRDWRVCRIAKMLWDKYE